MQWYFSHICDGTDVQADWRRSCTYGRAPNVHEHGTTLFIWWFRHPPHLVAFYDTLGIRKTYSRLKQPPCASSWGVIWVSKFKAQNGSNFEPFVTVVCGMSHRVKRLQNMIKSEILFPIINISRHNCKVNWYNPECRRLAVWDYIMQFTQEWHVINFP